MEANRDKSIDKLFDKMDEQTKILYKVDKDIAVLTEKSANYNYRLIAQEKLSEELHARIEKIENEVSIIKNNCTNNYKDLIQIKKINEELTKIKTGHRWISGICGAIGAFLGLLIGFLGLIKQ